jgi:hypothetical protein
MISRAMLQYHMHTLKHSLILVLVLQQITQSSQPSGAGIAAAAADRPEQSNPPTPSMRGEGEDGALALIVQMV